MLIAGDLAVSGQIPAQVIPLPKGVFRIPGRNSSAQYEVVFAVESLPPLSVSRFHLSQTMFTNKVEKTGDVFAEFHSKTGPKPGKDVKITNSRVNIGCI